MERHIETFREKGWTTLPFRDAGLVGQIVHGLEELLEAPEGVQRPWELDRTELFPQRGLVLSNGRAGCGSLTFQYSRRIRDKLRANGADVDGRADWMTACDRLWMRAFTVCLYAAGRLDRALPMRAFAESFDRERAVLQVLRVAPGHSGPVRRHIDPNAVTVHIQESIPVLQFEHEVPDQEPDTARVFAGAQMMRRTRASGAPPTQPELWGPDTIPACVHWAQMPEGRTKPWWAVVFFARGTDHIPRDELVAMRRFCLGTA